MAKAKNKDVNEIQVFEDFTDEEVMTISKYSEKKFYQRDEIVFEEKTKDASLYVVLKGRLQAFAHTDEGEKIPLSYIEQGEVFGELSFLDGKQRSATSRCWVTSTNKKEIWRFNKKIPSYFFQIDYGFSKSGKFKIKKCR